MVKKKRIRIRITLNYLQTTHRNMILHYGIRFFLNIKPCFIQFSNIKFTFF